MVFEDPARSVLKSNVDEALQTADAKTASMQPIQIHAISNGEAGSSFSTMARSQFMRLYMAPGSWTLYTGGVGRSAFGQLGLATVKGAKYGLADALESWTEKGIAPPDITATKYSEGNAVMTRPPCHYPETPKYNGTGGTNDAASFTWALPNQ